MVGMKDEIKKKILQAVRAIPSGLVRDTVVKETIRCVLYNFLKEQGLQPVPAFRVPRFQEGPVDMVGIGDDNAVAVAFCSNPTIELKDIKSLERVGCEAKFVISFSPNEKKVQMSTFFLKPGIEHIYIHEK
jgi:FKBP-type peptidyl-prolyl cis-trans isomerase (trigger factor)